MKNDMNRTIKTVLNFRETAKRVYELIAENPAKRIGWGFDGNLIATDGALPIYIWDGNINTTEEEFGGHFENSEAATSLIRFWLDAQVEGCYTNNVDFEECALEVSR